jgi:6-phosphogluconate dehydrogenase
MQIGMIGLGRMGGNMTQRLLRGGHACVVFDADALEGLVALLDAPRIVWLMIPAGAVDVTLQSLSPLLQAGDIIVDGGNSHYVDDIRRARSSGAQGIH